MKKIIVSFLLLFAISASFGVTAFAAPDSLYSDAVGNTTGLVNITSPQGGVDETFDKSYVVSGYGEVGTVVTIYSYNWETGFYDKLYKTVTTVNADGVYETSRKSVSTTIGESTLFLGTVNLNSGINYFMLYAEKGDRVQIVRLNVNKRNYNILDIIRSWGVY